MASSKIQHRRQRQGSLGLPKDSPPPPSMLTAVNGIGGGGACSGQAGPSQQSLDNLEMMKTIGITIHHSFLYTSSSIIKEKERKKVLKMHIILKLYHPYMVNVI